MQILPASLESNARWIAVANVCSMPALQDPPLFSVWASIWDRIPNRGHTRCVHSPVHGAVLSRD